jgi:hypothetical protein
MREIRSVVWEWLYKCQLTREERLEVDDFEWLLWIACLVLQRRFVVRYIWRALISDQARSKRSSERFPSSQMLARTVVSLAKAFMYQDT